MSWFKNPFKSTERVVSHAPDMLRLQDVRPNDMIVIEWEKIKGRIGEVRVVSNSPETKQMAVEMKWGNYIEADIPEYETIVINYKSYHLENFHVLNKMRRGPASGQRLPQK